MVQIGAIGLVKAWPKFDPNRNCSIETFVSYAVRGSIFRQLQEMWAQANHEAPPPDDEPVGPWPLPERAVLCREVVDFVSDLGVAEQSLIYGRIDDETYAALAAQLGLTLSAAVRWHARALKRVRRAAGVTYAPESATTCSVTT